MKVVGARAAGTVAAEQIAPLTTLHAQVGPLILILILVLIRLLPECPPLGSKAVTA